MRRDRVRSKRTKPATKPRPSSNFARPQQFAYDPREACRGRQMRKGNLPANPYELLAESKA